MLKTGDIFTATDQMKRKIRYKFMGINPNLDSGCRYILLKNLDDGTDTEVEIDWMRYRKIDVEI